MELGVIALFSITVAEVWRLFFSFKFFMEPTDCVLYELTVNVLFLYYRLEQSHYIAQMH